MQSFPSPKDTPIESPGVPRHPKVAIIGSFPPLRAISSYCLELSTALAETGLVEFHSIVHPTFNFVDGALIDMLSDGVDDLISAGFRGMVIGHQATHFSAGANLALILKYCEEQDWAMLENLSKTFQDVMQKLRFAAIPVIRCELSR